MQHCLLTQLQVPDGPGKLNKQQAIDKLVLFNHQVAVRNKEEDEIRKEEAKAAAGH